MDKGIEARHLQEVVRSVCQGLDLWSPSAENLLLGTAAQESHLGHYLKQLKKGPAIGIYQMEPDTWHDLHAHYLRYNTPLRNKLNQFVSPWGRLMGEMAMQGNLNYATACARLQYFRKPERLPAYDDIEGLARYWKKHWNTVHGKGTVEEFIENYQRFLGEL